MLVHLADYRLRYASYRRDPDLIALHAAKPMIMQPDDHETANDSWEGGATGHRSSQAWRLECAQGCGDEGLSRMAASLRRPASYNIRSLATLFRTENRVIGRTRQPDISRFFDDAIRSPR